MDENTLVRYCFDNDSKTLWFGWLTILFGMDGCTLTSLTALLRVSQHLDAIYSTCQQILLSSCWGWGPMLSVRNEVFARDSLPGNQGLCAVGGGRKQAPGLLGH